MGCGICGVGADEGGVKVGAGLAAAVPEARAMAPPHTTATTMKRDHSGIPPMSRVKNRAAPPESRCIAVIVGDCEVRIAIEFEHCGRPAAVQSGDLFDQRLLFTERLGTRDRWVGP